MWGVRPACLPCSPVGARDPLVSEREKLFLWPVSGLISAAASPSSGMWPLSPKQRDYRPIHSHILTWAGSGRGGGISLTRTHTLAHTHVHIQTDNGLIAKTMAPPSEYTGTVQPVKQTSYFFTDIHSVVRKLCLCPYWTSMIIPAPPKKQSLKCLNTDIILPQHVCFIYCIYIYICRSVCLSVCLFVCSLFKINLPGTADENLSKRLTHTYMNHSAHIN